MSDVKKIAAPLWAIAFILATMAFALYDHLWNVNFLGAFVLGAIMVIYGRLMA